MVGDLSVEYPQSRYRAAHIMKDETEDPDWIHVRNTGARNTDFRKRAVWRRSRRVADYEKRGLNTEATEMT